MSDGKLAAWRARHIGFVFQLYNLLPVLTAARNVELPLLLTQARRRRAARSACRRRSPSSGSLIERTTTRGSSPAARSSASVSPARSSPIPTLLLCDEPTGDLDRKSGDEILNLLQTLNREHGKTIVMVTHDPRAADCARRTLHLEKGLLVEEAVNA